MTTEESKIRICSIDKMEEADDLQPLWGNWIFRNSVILQAGEPGISKTTFNYALAKAVVDNKPFLGIKPTEEGLTILMLDWESSDALIKSRMRSMEYPDCCERFLVYNDPNFNIKDIEPVICNLDRKPDIIFIDPLRYAFGMEDENSNSEGSKQSKYLRQVADKHNCAVIQVHHSGKGEMAGWKKAVGASSRVSLADINMNFDCIGDGTDRSRFILSIPKNRLIDDKFVVFILKDNKEFKIIDPPAGYDYNGEPSLRQYGMQQWVELVLNPNYAKTPMQIHQELGGNNTCPLQSIYNLLSNLLTLGKARKVGHAKYVKIATANLNTKKKNGSKIL
jgi:predicted ATP-dependent serine protease